MYAIRSYYEGGEKLWVGLDSDARDGAGQPIDVRFDVMDAKPLPQSPNPSKQNQNIGVRKLFVKLDQVREMRLTVTMVPVVGSIEDTDLIVNSVPLDNWSISDGELIIPVIQSASIDGAPLAEFNEHKFSYA